MFGIMTCVAMCCAPLWQSAYGLRLQVCNEGQRSVSPSNLSSFLFFHHLPSVSVSNYRLSPLSLSPLILSLVLFYC